MDRPLYERDPDAWNAYLAEGNAKQARKRVAVDVLLRDHQSRILLVKPNYKPGWDLPGGMVEANEPPLDALRRELSEELGLRLPRYRLLCLDWVPPHDPWDDQLALIFDGGLLSEADRNHLSLRDKELADLQFFEEAQLGELIRPRLWRRLQSALDVLRSGRTAQYLHDGQPVER
jgi:8-oxo-dGTP diphosphatase